MRQPCTITNKKGGQNPGRLYGSASTILGLIRNPDPPRTELQFATLAFQTRRAPSEVRDTQQEGGREQDDGGEIEVHTTTP